MSCLHFKENHPACSDCSQYPLINAEENKSKYSLRNPQKREVCKIQVDSCVIESGKGKQCDYLFLSCEPKVAFFIELKGRDLPHAIDQLDQSLDRLLDKLEAFPVNARIVLSKTQAPDMRTPKYRKFKTRIEKLGGTFVHKNKLLEETLE